jgi:hypothetical protein
MKKLLPIILLAVLAACNSEPPKPKTPSDGTLKGDVNAAITDCGAGAIMKVGTASSTLVLIDLIDKQAAEEGKPGNEQFNCVFQAAIKMKDTLAVWNQKNIVVNRGKI